MDEPKSLDSLFKEKIFRIPGYQRGYVWQREQLKAFWEDLVNLSDRRSLCTGVLTLKQAAASEFPCCSTHSPLTPLVTSGRGTAVRALPVSNDS